MNNVKVQTKLIIVMLATIVALVLCAIISSESMKQLESKALETLEADERASYDEQIKQQVDNVISLCQTILRSVSGWCVYGRGSKEIGSR